MFKKKWKKPFICVYIGVEESLVTVFPAVFTFDSFLLTSTGVVAPEIKLSSVTFILMNYRGDPRW